MGRMLSLLIYLYISDYNLLIKSILNESLDKYKLKYKLLNHDEIIVLPSQFFNVKDIYIIYMLLDFKDD